MRRRTRMREFPTDAEVEEFARRVVEAFSPGLAEMLSSHGIDPRDGIRFQPVASRCREARERRGLTVKDAAREARPPQYRHKDIRNGPATPLPPRAPPRLP